MGTNILGITETIRREYEASRAASVKERLDANRKRLQAQIPRHFTLASSRENGSSGGLLSERMKRPPMMIFGDNINEEEEPTSMNSTKLPYVEKMPPYTTWTYSAKNEMMGEVESLIGKTLIYCKDGGIETLACSDSEDEARMQKYKFTPEDDHILRMVHKQFGFTDDVCMVLKNQFVGASDLDIQARSKMLELEDAREENVAAEWPIGYLENRLSEALDSLDILFCRRCLVFDCRLHGCSQPLIPSYENKPYLSDSEDEEIPCGDQCYRQDRGNIAGPSRKSCWKPVEKDLVLKGTEIFGRKSCLIARNLLAGLRSCDEVFSYMNEHVTPTIAGSIPQQKTKEGGGRKRVARRKRGSCKLRFSSKASSDRRSMSSGPKNGKLERHYRPCDCREPFCAPECSCLLRKTLCEKYCGCSKNCKNRYRGCYCPKGKCQTPQCPCFVSGRECDPDVCRYCWLSCGGDPILGEPPGQRECPCDNMKILRKQHQGVLLGKSDVSGWGVFSKNTLEKNDFLGEYTGEMISHREAEKRGKVYDRRNIPSYLFDLNDHYVVDAYRKGSKLKFLNHSFEPNCFAKVVFVGSDHRIGIYAQKHIEAGEELFYNYQYPDSVAPPWAQKPDGSTEKNDSAVAEPQGEGPAKKHQ